MVVITILWLSLILIGIQYNENIGDTALTEKNTMALRGICALEIVMGHLGNGMNSIILFPNKKAGSFFVGIFFALSGYGIIYSFINKERYLSGFIWKKMKRLLLPAYIVFLLEIVLNCILDEKGLNLVDIINVKQFFRITNWYVWELLVFYIAFYFCIKVFKNVEKTSVLMLGIAIIFVGIAYYLNFEKPWYGATMCFGLGNFYYLYKDKFKEYFVKKNSFRNSILCCLNIIASIVIFYILGGGIWAAIARNIASIFFVIFVFICLYRFNLTNGIAIWLGKYSYEIFLFHPFVFRELRPRIRDDVIFAFAAIGVTILVSYLYRIFGNHMKIIAGTIGKFFRVKE